MKRLPVLFAAMALALAAARAGALTPQELAQVKADEAARIRTIERVYGAVVAIYGPARGRGGGSGVLFDPDGFALTNYHVVRGAGRKGKAGLADGKLYDWAVYGIDPGGDLAIIRLAGRKRFPAVGLGDSRSVRVGDWAMAMGNPFLLAEDQKPTVTLGIVSGVERFQPGRGGGRTLVYGGCIQIDSSINPGNSGGPLFDIHGRLIGINGRGSFEERGRVNVGVGYAVSIEQAKNFLPDLLATRTCEHATLDAVFRDDDGKVLCNALNDNAAIAKLGMRLNDRLVAFDGTPVRSANHYLNLVSTMPAGWPVSVTFRRGADERTVWLRLRNLPYNMPQQRPRVRPRIIPKKKDDGEKPKGPTPVRVQPTPVVPGKIADKGLNRKECARLAGRWLASLGGRQAVGRVAALELEEAVVEGGKPIGRQRVLLARDGRFRIDVRQGYAGLPAGAAWGFDGKQLWRSIPGKDAPAEPGEPAAKSLEVALARVLAGFCGDEPLEPLKAVELEGGDRTQGQRAFRLRVEDPEGNKLLLWLSLFGDGGQGEARLLKVARDSSQKGADRAWTLSDYRPVAGLIVPHRRRRVRGLEERPIREFVAASVKALDSAPDAAFGPAVEGKD